MYPYLRILLDGKSKPPPPPPLTVKVIAHLCWGRGGGSERRGHFPEIWTIIWKDRQTDRQPDRQTLWFTEKLHFQKISNKHLKIKDLTFG